MKETKGGKDLRPHVKSHKCVEIGKYQVGEEGGAIGLAAAKISEARPFVLGGLTDILITSPTSQSSKIDLLVDLWIQSEHNLSTVVDSEEGISMLSQSIRSKRSQPNEKMKIVLDIDGGNERTGVQTLEEARFICDLVVKNNDVFDLIGAQTYLGHIQHITNIKDRQKASEEGLGRGFAILKGLREDGKYGELKVHTGVGTGTHEFDSRNPSISEIQPGSYCLMDSEYALIEWENPFWSQNVPMTLLTSIVSNKHFPRHITVDAGWKATYLFPAAPNIVLPPSCSNPSFPKEGVEMTFSYQGDEHGRVSFAGDRVDLLTSEMFPLGGTLEIQVSHVDPTVNLHDFFFLLDDDDICCDVLKIDARG
eukprot:CAMPEP_0201504736 /NCGR_PEP_ID=MMETSP0151_2-20130828/85379_1 /ASSEMBLY_ACC=CAM_ASM_000257 /TAXON_ID=200890 /ORGANISM="Paramoeba atlantica, Strain 621/1 / CCAP 1560/9" /LENGTH=364 /DNA_ID=CAMNT_0047898521 /DNA_START=122 /DNA_END=1212 /DNA_ORIENTATION=+